MYQEGDHYHYTDDEVRGLFRQEVDNGNWLINETEFRNLCKLLSCIKTEFVDMLKNEVHTVVVSLERGVRMDEKKMPCATINLKDKKFLEARKCVIVFSPYLLTLPFACVKLKKIFHEIAHYKLNHPMTLIDAKMREANEQEADRLAYEWLNQEKHHLNGLTSSETNGRKKSRGFRPN